MRLSPDSRWTPSICPDDARSHQWPYKLPESLVSSALQWRILRELRDNRARNSNNRSPWRDGPPAGPAPNESLSPQRHALFPFARALDRSRDNSIRAPVPMQQMRRQILDQVSLLRQKTAQPFLYCCGIYQPDKTPRVLA